MKELRALPRDEKGHITASNKKTMKLLFNIILLILLSCNINSKEGDNKIPKSEETNFQPNPKVKCVTQSKRAFIIDDFGSEGNEGNVYFINDTIIDKIEFNYATSMIVINEIYFYKSNQLYKVEKIKKFLDYEKTDYLRIDSIVVMENKNIIKNGEFDNDLYQELMKAVIEINPCLKNKI